MKLEDKIYMMRESAAIARNIEDPIQNQERTYEMVGHAAENYGVSPQVIKNTVFLEQMHINGYFATQLKLDLGLGEHKIYQEIR